MNEILSSPADDSAALPPTRKKAPAAKKTAARKTAAEITPPPAPAPAPPIPEPVAKAPAKKAARKKVEAVVESAPAPAPPVAAKKTVAKKAARKAAAADQGQLPLMLSEPAPVPAVATPAVAEAPAPKKKVARKTARATVDAGGPVGEVIAPSPSPAPGPTPSATPHEPETAPAASENPRTRRLGRGLPQDERGRAPRQENQTREEAQVPPAEAAPTPSSGPQRPEGPPPRQEHGPRHDGPPRPDGPPRHHQGPQRPHDGPPRQDPEGDPNVIIGPDGQPRRLNKWERWKQRKEKFKLLKQQRYLERQAGAPPRPGPGQGQGESPHAEQQGPRRPDDQRPGGQGGQGGPPQRERFQRPEYPPRPEPPPLGPPEPAAGLLEFSGKGIAFLRPADRGYAASPMDTFVSPELIRQFGLREGVVIEGLQRRGGRGPQLVEIKTVNGLDPNAYRTLPLFEELTAINPNKRYVLETSPNVHTTRLIDFIAPIGRGQRGLIVAPPRAGKTTFLQHIAEAVIANYESVKVIVLLVDERPEEVTELARALPGAEIMASSNDQDPRNHIRMAQLAVERAKRLVEAGEHVFMLLDSITRLARAFNNAMRGGGGKAMSGGIDSRALELPRKLFAAARNTREAGSLTIMATALVETNNKGDDLIFQEFKGTGNMELVLDRKISQQYVYPAVDIFKSGTRREELLLPPHQLEKVHLIRRGLAGHRPVEAVERLLHFMKRFPSNAQMLVEIKSRE